LKNHKKENVTTTNRIQFVEQKCQTLYQMSIKHSARRGIKNK